MKLFYICPPERTEDLPPVGAHWFDLGTGKVFVCVDWQSNDQEIKWSSLEGVVPLPHPIFEATTPLTDEHRQHLAGRYKTNSGDTIHHIVKQAAQEDLWMRLWVL